MYFAVLFVKSKLCLWFNNVNIKNVVKNIRFQVKTPHGVLIHTTKEYWLKIITTKHPSIAKHEDKVKEALKDPDEIRRSKQDEEVYLYYKNIGKLYVCVIIDQETLNEGYIITAYLTDRIKEGEQIYVKT